ncbi:MAG TPA: hypothetical protein DCY18_15230, partial [Thauera sp.]|nr:hypothetical protein [Thauera sp.]
MLSLARILLAGLFAAFVLGGCSVRMAYSQLDWLVPWYLRDYVMLDAGQRNLLDRQLSARLDWHCRTHLAEYAATLREAQTTLAADRIGSSDLLPYLARGEGWWREILAALEDDAR